MSYEVLARKWRPQTFAEVVGQDHIARTLQNAIRQHRVGHAYLFVGPRGIGKTTTARIFAKALNCETGEVVEPCCRCQSCREIAAGTSLDVIEIDGASHNRVEHIRDIRDNVQYTPSRSRYKIYIIDEVHMLTTSAWNALLKTLEEPPAHVKFLFATTEPHKVLPTIVSRCQRFDLKRIPVPLIVARLQQIAAEEGVDVEERALAAVARAADGALRDAQSIFDQMIAFCGGRDAGESIAEADVIEVFGLASGAELQQLAASLIANDLDAMMTAVQALADRGRDLERLYADLVQFVRNLLICRACRHAEKILEVSEGELADLKQTGPDADAALVQRLLQGLVTHEAGFRAALNKRVYLEAALARVLHDAHSVQIDAVLARLLAMQQHGTAAPAEAPRAERQSAPQAPGEKPAPHAAPRERAGHAGTDAAGTRAAAQTRARRAPGRAGAAHGAAAAADERDTSAEDGDESDPPPRARTRAQRGSGDESAAQASASRERDGGETETATAGETGTTDPHRLWHALVEEVDKVPGRHQLKLFMQELRAVAFRDNVLQVAFDEDVPEEHTARLQATETVALMNRCLQRIVPGTGARVLIKRWIDSVSNEHAPRRRESSPELIEQAMANPFVRQVCDLFDAEVIDVRG